MKSFVENNEKSVYVVFVYKSNEILELFCHYSALFNSQYIYNKTFINLYFIQHLFIFLPFFKHKRFSPPKFVLTRIDRSWEPLTCHKTIVKAAPENHINTLFNGFTLRLRTLERSMAKKQKKLRITIQIHTDTVPLRPHVLTRSTG